MPARSTDRLPRTSPEAQGVDRVALESLIADLDALGGIHGLVVLRHGQVIAEATWAPYQPERPHMLFSASKSVTAFAIGCAVAEGLLSVEDRVLDLLPKDAPAKPSRRLRDLHVKHLLTMTSGRTAEPQPRGKRWARTILAQPLDVAPGERFFYSSMATYLLSAIITRLTGQRLLDYLTPRLFAPLGIPVGEDGAQGESNTLGATWEHSPEGVDFGGWGLSLTTEDLAKFGQLLLQGGRWHDRQLVPAEWVATMMSNLSDPTPMQWGPDWRIGYGYQMWRCAVDASRCDGAFGQFAIVWPEHDAVIATTAGVGGSGSAGTQELLDAIWQNLSGAFESGMGRDGTRIPGFESLNHRMLSLPLPVGQPSSSIADAIDGVPYRIGRTQDTVTVSQHDDHVEVAFTRQPATVHQAAFGDWRRYSAPGPDGQPQPAAAAYAWTSDNTLTLLTYGTATPFGWTITLTWPNAARGDLDRMELAIDQNVSFEGTEILRAKARRSA